MNPRFEEFAERWRDPDLGPTLNLGCGWDRRSDSINLDLVPLQSADVAGSVDGPYLPFRDRSFGFVFAEDILEHVDHVAAMREIHRVLRPGGVLALSSVHFSSRDLWVDPTHRRGFSARTFEFFADSWGESRGYYFDFSFSQVAEVIIDFPQNRAKALTGNRLIRSLANRSPDLYELTFGCRAFPAGNVFAALRR